MDPAFYALSLLRRRKFTEAIDRSTELLEKNAYDQQIWYIKTRALTQKNWLDDTDLEEDGIAEALLDDHSMGGVARPGTSLRTATGSRAGSSAGVGRPTSAGFARPGSQRTGSRAGSSAGNVESAFQGNRPGTSRPVTSSGRLVRLGTASMKSESGGPFIQAERLDFKKYAQRAPLAKVLCDYIIYHDHNPRRALELCAEATKASNFKDWWWKARLGKCYYQLGLFPDAEKQFKSALKQEPMVVTMLELAKVHFKLDHPLTALDMFEQAIEKNKVDVHLRLAIARTNDQLGASDKAVAQYRDALQLDSSNPEAIACLASYHFYEDQPEVALRLYRRLLQMGVNSTELWNNLGLCSFYASQYDKCLHCFEKALSLATDENMADAWYNLGQIAVGIGDLGLAYQCFKVAISIDSSHAESYNNLAVLELRKNNVEQARNNFIAATKANDTLHESNYNSALLSFKLGDFQDAYANVQKALESYPDHSESLELKKQLKQHFAII